jgi:hypothetical protein
LKKKKAQKKKRILGKEMKKGDIKKIDLNEAKNSSLFFDGKKDIQKLGAGDSFYISNFMKKGREEIF